MVAVSCNPATFARDARILTDGGYRAEACVVVDQFLWSSHIELVGLFCPGGRLTADDRTAFAADRQVHAAHSAVKRARWITTAMALRALARPSGVEADESFAPTAPPAPKGFVRQAWLEAFEKDAADVAAGLYPPWTTARPSRFGAVRRPSTSRRRHRRSRRAGAAATGRRCARRRRASYPAYYRQNFHFQSGGWFTAESARRYEAQVEALFVGAAGAMRRRALSLLARAWRDARPPRPRHARPRLRVGRLPRRPVAGLSRAPG